MKNVREYYVNKHKNQFRWAVEKPKQQVQKNEQSVQHESKKQQRDQVKQKVNKPKKTNKGKKQFDFGKAKIITILVLIVALAMFDVYAILSCLSYMDKYNIVTEVGQEVDIDGYKPNVRGYDTSWMFNKEVDEINWNQLGTYRVKYIPKFFGIAQTLTIRVVDTTAPEIKLADIGDNDCFANIEDAIARKYVAIDNYDGDITDQVKVEYLRKDASNYLIIYTVKDSSGNEQVLKQEVKLARGLVALTFDDGPSRGITPQILDLLKKYDIKATFFVLGFEGREDLIKREFDEGHTIGYHGYTHDYSIYTSVTSVLDNFKKIEKMVTDVTGGESSNLVRFPGGSSNTVSKKYCTGVMTEATKAVEDAGYVYYDWNIDSDDAGSAKTAEDIVKNVTSTIKPGRLNVILMHDAEGKTKTLEALEDIIIFCKNNGYSFVKLNSELDPVHHGIAN